VKGKAGFLHAEKMELAVAADAVAVGESNTAEGKADSQAAGKAACSCE
jgi:hypothetical protein